MKNVEILENMLKLQQKLNDETNGLNWEEGYTKEGKLINGDVVFIWNVPNL